MIKKNAAFITVVVFFYFIEFKVYCQENFHKELYKGKVTPIELITYISDTSKNLVFILIDTDSLPSNWISRTDIKLLMDIIDSIAPAANVIDIKLDFSYSSIKKSTISNEIVKIINGYICNCYLKRNDDYLSLKKIKKWWKKNEY